MTTRACIMNGNLAISDYLADVYEDWQDSQDAFPNNIYLTHYWPIPFFGNPRTAIVATVGVNPSSGEFNPGRNWSMVQTKGDWKKRLKNYFAVGTPHKCFNPWCAGLKLLGVSYAGGTAAHFDASYRPTKAMLKNATTDRGEFRHMVERDVAWLFRLLPLCPNLRGFLVFGPVVRHDGSTESLAGFVCKSAPRHGFSVLRDGGLRVVAQDATERSFFVHEVQTSGRGTITEQVVENLEMYKDSLKLKLA